MLQIIKIHILMAEPVSQEFMKPDDEIFLIRRNIAPFDIWFQVIQPS